MKLEKIIGLLINSDKKSIEEKETLNSFRNVADSISCNFCNAITQNIGGNDYAIFYDMDQNSNNLIAINPVTKEGIYGDIFVFKFKNGEIVSLEGDDFQIIGDSFENGLLTYFDNEEQRLNFVYSKNKTNNKKKKEKFFNFEDEVYDENSGKFYIPNLKSEGERLGSYIDSKVSAIEDEEDLDKKTYLTQNYIKESKSLKKEISEKKTEITKKHIKDLTNDLSDLSKMIEEIQEQVKDHTSAALIDAGMADVFYTAPAFEIRTSPITDTEKLQLAIAFLNQLGIETKIYQDGKLLKTSAKEENKDEEEKTSKIKEDDSSYKGRC